MSSKVVSLTASGRKAEMSSKVVSELARLYRRVSVYKRILVSELSRLYRDGTREPLLHQEVVDGF